MAILNEEVLYTIVDWGFVSVDCPFVDKAYASIADIPLGILTANYDVMFCNVHPKYPNKNYPNLKCYVFIDLPGKKFRVR